MTTIRQATIDDLPDLCPVAKEFYDSSKYLDGFDLVRFCKTWDLLINSGAGVIFLIEEHGEVIGTIGGVKHEDLYSGRPVATEFFWFVMPERRGKGMELYYRFEDWAKQNGCTQIRMTHLCDVMPDGMRWLYGELGFEAIEINYAKELKK